VLLGGIECPTQKTEMEWSFIECEESVAIPYNTRSRSL